MKNFFSKHSLKRNPLLSPGIGVLFGRGRSAADLMENTDSLPKTSFPGLDLTSATSYKNDVASVAQSDRAGAF